MATPTFAREALPPPPQELLRQSRIRFLHPSYTDNDNVLLELPRVDLGPANAGETRTASVHHGTALVACQIIANNAFNGRLAEDAGGQQQVDAPLDSILVRDVYYFFVGDGPDIYIYQILILSLLTLSRPVSDCPQLQRMGIPTRPYPRTLAQRYAYPSRWYREYHRMRHQRISRSCWGRLSCPQKRAAMVEAASSSARRTLSTFRRIAAGPIGNSRYFSSSATIWSSSVLICKNDSINRLARDKAGSSSPSQLKLRTYLSPQFPDRRDEGVGVRVRCQCSQTSSSLVIETETATSPSLDFVLQGLGVLSGLLTHSLASSPDERTAKCTQCNFRGCDSCRNDDDAMLLPEVAGRMTHRKSSGGLCWNPAIPYEAVDELAGLWAPLPQQT